MSLDAESLLCAIPLSARDHSTCQQEADKIITCCICCINSEKNLLSSSLSTLSQHRDPCAGPRNSTLGATATCTCAAAKSISSRPSSIAQLPASTISRSNSPITARDRPCASAGQARPRPRRSPKPPNSASSRRSRMPKRRARSARSASAPRPGLRPLAPRSRSSSGNTASSVHLEAATVSPAPASTARTRYRKPLPPRTPRERR